MIYLQNETQNFFSEEKGTLLIWSNTSMRNVGLYFFGPRRVGKTSLAKCAIEKSGLDSIILDARETLISQTTFSLR